MLGGGFHGASFSSKPKAAAQKRRLPLREAGLGAGNDVRVMMNIYGRSHRSPEGSNLSVQHKADFLVAQDRR